MIIYSPVITILVLILFLTSGFNFVSYMLFAFSLQVMSPQIHLLELQKRGLYQSHQPQHMLLQLITTTLLRQTATCIPISFLCQAMFLSNLCRFHFLLTHHTCLGLFIPTQSLTQLHHRHSCSMLL